MSKRSMAKARQWRSLNDLASTPEFVEKTHREFPEQADEIEMDGVSRRQFMGLMGASTAMGGALSGCVRKPAQYILPYAERPEDFLPGESRYFASVLHVGGLVQGVLVESQDGRPTKIEGNPRHHASQGRTTAMVQSAVLNMYDPDRSRGAVVDGTPTPVADALAGLPAAGRGTAFLVNGTPSPTLNSLLARATQNGAAVYRHGPDAAANQEAGLATVTSDRVRPVYDTAAAKVLVALDSDFLGSGADSIRHAAGFAAGRRPDDGRMNRLYAVEPAFSVTGATADNRLQLPASQVGEFAKALCDAVAGTSLGSSGVDSTWVSAVAADLQANSGNGLIFVGERQPAWVHAIAARINDAVGSSCISYVPSATPEGGSLRDLVSNAGSIDTLVVLGGNPVFASPGDVDVAAVLGSIGTTIHVGHFYDETGRACGTHLPEAFPLEAWGDLQSIDGQTAIAQPLIEPLFDSITAIDVVGKMVGAEEHTTRELVQAYWRSQTGRGDFDANWQRWLHDGVTSVPTTPSRPQFRWSSLGGSSPSAPTASAFEVNFTLDAKIYDGRYSNNAWLQELPDPISKLTWDNAALMGPVTARALGIAFGTAEEPTDGDRFEEDSNIPSTLRGDLEMEMVTVTVDGRSLELPAFVVPGVADNTVTIALGYGRDWGSVARGVGFDSYALLGESAIAAGATVSPAGGSYKLATTQDHGSMEGRPLVREATAAEYAEDPHFATTTIFEGGPELMPSEKLHSLWEPPNVRTGQQWGMTIDLGTCIGCSACTAACNIENNISVVGKERVLEGREMHWIRLDRYFSGDPGNPDVHMQPVGCLHCENAPCEQVCPVAATTHGPEGTNDMAYNRCIGTRYCANNCPYKVRRFNYFNFARENDERNPLLDLQKNADVTVRFRGVMEKCTYCVQRINAAKIDAKVQTPEGVVADGGITVACEQACPTGAIIFGDVNDPNSRVSRSKAADRDYALLSWLNSHPRTTYLARITNPNPELS